MRTSITIVSVLALISSNALADETSSKPVADGYITPTTVPYEGGEIPANAKLVSKPNLTVLGTGIGLFAASYAGALIYGLATCSAQENCRGGSGYLYIPFIGPFITATVNDTPTTGGRALAAFDGGVQVVGGLLTAASFIWPQKFVMWQSKSAAVSVIPTGAGDKGFGAGLAITVTHL